MISPSELSKIFSEDLFLGRTARTLLRSPNAATGSELTPSSSASCATMTAKALERLCELGLAQRASEAQSGLSYIILPEARPLVEEAVLAMDDAFIAKRAAAWKIDVRGRLEWIEGMDEMIRKGKESYYANLR